MAFLESDEPRSVLGRLERRIRRLVTRRMLQEAEQVRAAGTKVTMLAPVADDLRAIGVNMMNSRRRELVLETSLRTIAARLRSGRGPLDLASVG
jgi:NTE family protein